MFLRENLDEGFNFFFFGVEFYNACNRWFFNDGNFIFVVNNVFVFFFRREIELKKILVCRK